MSRKKAHKKEQESTTLVPHRTPNLSALLERAKSGDVAQAVKAYLDAGGAADTLVRHQHGLITLQLPLLHIMAFTSAHPHKELAESVGLLMDAGADINDKRAGVGDQWTPLIHEAGKKCCTEVSDILLRAGADPCVRTSPGRSTALHIAAKVGLAETCEMLIAKAGSSILEVRDCQGLTALKYAAIRGRTDNIKVLLQHGADVNAADNNRATPLFAASLEQHTNVARQLLEAGADVNALDANRHSALRAAVVSNNTALFVLVLQYGADIGVTDVLGQNELFSAAQYGHVCMMELLVQRGLSVHATDSSKRTPLIIAVVARQHATAEWLLQHGAAVDAVGNNGVTALRTVCDSASCDDATMVELLLTNGANVQRVNPETGATALDAAAVHGHLQCAQLLIAAGADVNFSITGSFRCLHMAIMAQEPAVVQLLLEHGATAVMNSVLPVSCFYGDCYNSTLALMLCSTAATVKVLLAAGADVHVTTAAGDTCLHVAVRHSYKAPVMCLLIKAGVDLHAVNSSGKTAAQLAHDRGNVLIAQLLNRAAQQER
jgi:ankyrin repeat protein